MTETSEARQKTQTLPVYRAADLCVVRGANEGDGLSFASDLVLDDTYTLDARAEQVLLSLSRGDTGQLSIGQNSTAGHPQNTVHLDCAVSLMAFGGPVIECLVLVEVDASNHVQQIYVLPLAGLEPKTEYDLVGIDTDKRSIAKKFAQVACVSFTRGTQITLGSGQQRRIEDLVIGDRVLTRDDGIQQIRWIGKSTQRAHGAFAPIRITTGTLNNANDLLVSPDHRLFIYQRSDTLGVGRSELLVKARHLINGSSITVEHGGFVEYYQLLFDAHQIIYAEGIAAESMLMDDRTAPLIDASALKSISPDHRHHQEMSGLDVQKALLQRDDAADLLKRASKG